MTATTRAFARFKSTTTSRAASASCGTLVVSSDDATNGDSNTTGPLSQLPFGGLGAAAALSAFFLLIFAA